MAWNIHWQCCFQSRNRVQYAVNIYEQDYAGSIVQLTGSDKPFVTQEDDDENIFTPIRIQSGYLRVVTDGSSLMDDIVPSNNTEKMVQLVMGTYSGTWPNGTFTQTPGDEAVLWVGFLQAQAYSQPWDGQKVVLEFPVKSMLATLADAQIPDTVLGNTGEGNVAALLVSAFGAIGVNPSSVSMVSDIAQPQAGFLQVIAQSAIFFSEEEVVNEGDSERQLVGDSYYNALSAIASLFGLTVREEGNRIYFTQYDVSRMELPCVTYTWQQITDIAGGVSTSDVTADYPEKPLLSNITFRGASNLSIYLQGGKSAVVTLPVASYKDIMLTLPQTTEDASSIDEVDVDAYGGISAKVYAQPHTTGTSAREAFSFYRYVLENAPSGSTFDYQFRIDGGASNYLQCLNNSFLKAPELDLAVGGYVYAGAFPCRWFYQKESEVVRLVNGLFLNQAPACNGDDIDGWSPIYMLESLYTIDESSGYLNIQAACERFSRYQPALAEVHNRFGPDTKYTKSGNEFTWYLYFGIDVGNKRWDSNGNGWVPNTRHLPSPMRFEVDKIQTNKTDDMNVEATDGWFIPINTHLSGKVRLYIYSACRFGTFNPNRMDSRSAILHSLSVDVLKDNPISVSYRGENIYRRTIMATGFSEEKAIDLTVGTMNNNVASTSFVKSSATEYLEKIAFHNGSHSKLQRPELHLLDRMATHYDRVRRAFTGTVERGVELLHTIYTYQDCWFFGVRATTDWREEAEEVKFIEVEKYT